MDPRVQQVRRFNRAVGPRIGARHDRFLGRGRRMGESRLLFEIGQEPVGCGALKAHGDGVADIKRMWVSEAVRGLGVGRRMLAALEEQARGWGVGTLRLETNASLEEAQSLYRRSGYFEIAPFSDEAYAHHWFEKRL